MSRDYFHCSACGEDVNGDDITTEMRHEKCGALVEPIDEAWEAAAASSARMMMATLCGIVVIVGIIAAIAWNH